MTADALSAVDAGIDQPRRTFAIASVLAGMTLVVLDAAIANVALPSIGDALDVTPALAIRVVTAYQLGLVVTLLPAAALGESLGFRRVFIAGAALFVAASLGCMLAPSLNWLVLARFVQGVGGASIMALGVALLRVVVPKHRLGAAIGWNALTVALATAAGPTLGATILSVGSWPWLFAVNLPIGALVLLTARALPKAMGTGRALDFTSLVLNTGMFALLAIGAACIASKPALAGALWIGAAIQAAILIRREAQLAAPLIPLDLLRSASFRLSVVASILCFAGQAAAFVALPFYLRHAFGLSILTTGLYLLPWPLTVAFAGPLAGQLAERASTALLCLIGAVSLTLGLGVAANLTARASPLAFVACMMLCGLGFGLFNVPNNRNMFLSAPRERSGAAGGMQSIARLTGQTAGAVCVSVLFELTSLDAASRFGLTMGAMLALAAGLVSMLRSRGAMSAAP